MAPGTCPAVPPGPSSLTLPPPPQAIAHEIYTELVEDACLGLCFEVHRAVKCGYFFLDDTDPDSMKDFGEGTGTRGQWEHSERPPRCCWEKPRRGCGRVPRTTSGGPGVPPAVLVLPECHQPVPEEPFSKP